MKLYKSINKVSFLGCFDSARGIVFRRLASRFASQEVVAVVQSRLRLVAVDRLRVFRSSTRRLHVQSDADESSRHGVRRAAAKRRRLAERHFQRFGSRLRLEHKRYEASGKVRKKEIKIISLIWHLLYLRF